MDKLRILMDSFLAKIRELAPQTDFWVTGYESWRIYQDKDSPLKINQIDCFIYDRVNWTQVRLLLEIIEMPTKESMGKYECRHINDKSLQTCAKETTPEFPTYPVGYPVNNQLIELPTETITSGNQVANYKGINFPIPCPFEKLWINWVEIVNSSLVLNAFENYPDKQLEGIYNIPFDHSEYKLKGKYFPYQDINRVTNQWPTINTQPKGVEPWPCTPVPFVWDSQGVRPEVKPTRTCPGKRTSLFETELTASYDPSMFNYPRGVTDYTWLFANTNKDMGLAYEGY